MPRRSSVSVPRRVRGSVITHRRRCGRPTRHRADGISLHESTVLSYSEASRTRFLMLPPEKVAAVRAATGRYRSRKAWVEAEGDQGLAQLVAALAPAGRRS